MSKTLHHIPEGQEALYAAAPMLLAAAKRWYTRSAKLRQIRDEIDPQHDLADWDAMDDLKAAIRHAEGAA